MTDVYHGEDIALDLYPKTDPKNGPRIRRLTSLQTGSFIRREQKGTGVVTIVIPGDSDDAEAIDPALGHYIKGERKAAVIDLALSAAADDIVDTQVAHGLAVGHKLEFVSLTGGAGLSLTPAYYVESVPSSTSLRLAATKGGAALDFTTDITAGSIRRLTTVAGGFLLGGNYNALSADGTKPLVLTGPGPLHYLARARMAPHSYLGDDPQPEGVFPLHMQGAWFGDDHYGSEFARAITEMKATQADDPGDDPDSPHPNANDRLDDPLPAITFAFDGFTDSNGVPWTGARGEFDVQVALEDGLRIAFRFMQAGLELDIDPDTFELRAYNTGTLGTDRSGPAWGAGIVRFQVPTDNKVGTSNVFTTAKRALAAFIQRSLVWAGRENVWGVARNASAPVRWEGGYSSQASDEDALNTIAGQQITERTDAGDVPRLKVWAGIDEAAGRYTYGPAGHADIWDRGTVHSGTGTWDWNEWEGPLSAIEWRIENPNGEFDTFVEFGSTFRSLDEVMRFAGGAVGVHGPHIRLCVPGVAGSPPVLVQTGSDIGAAEAGSITLNVSAAHADRALYVFAHVVQASGFAPTWQPDGVAGPNDQALTKIHSTDRGASGPMAANSFEIWRLVAPNPGASGVVAWANPLHHIVGAFYLRGVNQATPNATPVGNTGTGVTSSLTVTATSSQLALNAAGFRVDNVDPIAGPTAGGGQTQAWSRFQDSSVGNSDLEQGGGSGSSAPTWTFGSSQPWTAVGVAVNGSSSGSVNDGHADLVGTSPKAARCDHRHDVHRDTAPTVNDDWATKGYKLGTIWARLDSLAAPTEIVGTWMLVDATAGAAIWLELPSGLTQAEVDALIATHAAAADPHTGYQKESEKGAANGYASLGAGGLVPMAQLATGTPDGTTFVRDDGTLAAPGGSGFHYEVLMTGASPAEPLEDGSGTDWLYVLVAD